ncbi:SGNH/GDSL hydrolase family protein [Bradyrhizobium sp. STM 3557]|uniref:SGNH/GDSL hydrolase family protein n=1 Tax=Bradyrhizobium sp. STM 3557 TaxID=578920 RepID=UPI00388DE8AA
MTDGSVCNPYPDLMAFGPGLGRLRASLKGRRKTRIVAIGSSSTSGEGNVIPYPHRLELALRARFPDRMVDVINRGIGGQEAPEEAARFESDVLLEEPALVIWQVGTNAIYHRELYDPARVAAAIAAGLSWLKTLEADIILMDLQYAPELLTATLNECDRKDPQKQKAADADRKAATLHMVELIRQAATDAGVNLFRRFALMQRWVEQDHIDIEKLINASDRLHQTEFGTAGVSNALYTAIKGAIGDIPGAAV